MAKRLFDIAAALFGLITLWPVMMLIALMVKLDSPGPVFFRQERVGRHGALFHILKFRTMRDEPGRSITIGTDPRITRFGAALRETKLDELPQLFNILRGEMSVVGPRPELPRYVAKWPDDMLHIVLSVRPGLTDPASIRFRDESEILAQYPDPEVAYETVITPEKLRLYAEYVRTASLAGDLRLILETAKAVLR